MKICVYIAVYNSNSWTEAAEQPGTRTAKVATSGVHSLRNAKINSVIFLFLTVMQIWNGHLKTFLMKFENYG